jgi:ABC-type bacteriocin/lantibiotic exporter with double-glycine peptidase domain
MPPQLLFVEHSIQEGEVGCLAACAQMVLRRLGITVDQRRLNWLFDQVELGALLSHIQRLTHYGVKVALQAGDENDIKQAIDQGTPPVVFVRTSQLTTYWQEDAQHAVVVIGYDERHFYVNDPAFPDAPKLVPIDEFVLAWLELDYIYALVSR